MLRVLHVLPGFVSGGIERLLQFSAKPMAEVGVYYGAFIFLPEGGDTGELAREGVPMFRASRWRPRIVRWACPPELRRDLNAMCKTFAPDLVHAQHAGALPAAQRLAKFLGVPYVVSNQSMDEPWQRPKTDAERLEFERMREAQEKAAAVVCVGEAVKENIASLGWTLRRLTVIENVVSDSVWTPAPDAASRTVDVIMLGRLAPQKNPEMAARVLIEMARRYPDFTASVLGDGESRPAFQAAVEAANLTDRIRLLGHQPPDAVIAEARRAKVFYAPSLFEGLSLAMVEALAHGLDAVVSKSPSFVRPFSGLPGVHFADAHDFEANVAALEAARAGYQRRDRSDLQERFSVARYVREMSDLYRTVAAK